MPFQITIDFKINLAVANGRLFDGHFWKSERMNLLQSVIISCFFNSMLTFYFSGAVIIQFGSHAVEEARATVNQFGLNAIASQDQTLKCAHADSAYTVVC